MKAKSDKSYYRYAREDVFALVPTGVLDSTHLRFFTFKSARRLLTESGFEIEVFRGRAVGDIWWAKALLVLLAPVICLVGWDVCRTQMLFRARKGLVG